MKPRIFKKLCKRVAEIAGDTFGEPWIDDEEPFAPYYLDIPHSERCSMSGLLVVGGGPDYFGEIDDPTPLYTAAVMHVLWAFGERKLEALKDEDGNVIDMAPGWPEYRKRLTGKEVIQKLRLSIDAQKAA